MQKQTNTLDIFLQTPLQWINEGRSRYKARHYEKALHAYEHAIQLDPNHSSAYSGKGNCLFCLDRYQEALHAYEHAIHLNPNHSSPSTATGNSPPSLPRYPYT